MESLFYIPSWSVRQLPPVRLTSARDAPSCQMHPPFKLLMHNHCSILFLDIATAPNIRKAPTYHVFCSQFPACLCSEQILQPLLVRSQWCQVLHWTRQCINKWQPSQIVGLLILNGNNRELYRLYYAHIIMATVSSILPTYKMQEQFSSSVLLIGLDFIGSNGARNLEGRFAGSQIILLCLKSQKLGQKCWCTANQQVILIY